MTAQPFPVCEIVASRRPHRKDAARNFDALLAAAREAFAEQGRRGLPGGHRPPGGCRHRHAVPELPDPPPSLQSVYSGEVDELCRAAEDVAELRRGRR